MLVNNIFSVVFFDFNISREDAVAIFRQKSAESFRLLIIFVIFRGACRTEYSYQRLFDIRHIFKALHKFRHDAEYRENVNTERNDERNKYLSMKAWQLTAGWFVMIAAIATFIFKFAGREDLMMLCSGGVCLMVALYWICFLYLKKKY